MTVTKDADGTITIRASAEEARTLWRAARTVDLEREELCLTDGEAEPFARAEREIWPAVA